MKKITSILIVLAVTLTSSGCVSASAHNGKNPAEPYTGVRRLPSMTKEYLAQPETPVWEPAIVLPIAVADLPLEAALDTIFLPTDAIGCLTSNRNARAQSTDGRRPPTTN